MGNRQRSFIKYDPVVFPVKLWVAEYDLDLFNKFNTIDGREISIDILGYSSGFTSPVLVNKRTGELGIVVIIMNKNAGSKTVAHEATHVSQYLFEHIGEKEIGKEIAAYLVGWAADCITDFLIRKGK